MKRRLLPACLALFLLLCASPLSPAARAYSDTADTWAAASIEKARDYGLITGYPDGAFGVGREISRAEFVTILCRMFDWAEVVPETPSYPDCPVSKWCYGAVEAARAHGVMAASGFFRPDDYISREEMAVMLVRALGYDTLAQSLDGTDLPFSDVSRNRGYIAIAYDIGMITGVAQNGELRFKPDFSAKREEAAAMLVRVYERYASKVDWLHGFYAFSSYAQINLTPSMDAVSVGWARMEYDPVLGPVVNSTAERGNDWVKPADPTPATDYFQSNGTPYHLNLYASASDRITLPGGTETSTVAALVSTPEARTAAVSAITAAAEDYAGITVDFEALKGEDLKARYPQFLSQLRAALPADKTLYVCVQPGTWYTGYDYRAIGEACDRVILMAHDYQWTSVPAGYVGAARTDSPVTPFPSVYQALREITDPQTGVQDRSKLALAISFGSAGFKVDEAGVLLEPVIYHPAPATVAQRLAQADTVITYDEKYRNPAALYTGDDGNRYRLWYEDARSVSDKIELARMFGITGVSLWRLGNVPTGPGGPLHYDVWSAVQAQRNI